MAMTGKDGAPRIAVLSNIQHESLAIGLRALLPDADIVSHDLASLPRDDGARQVLAAALAGRDHVVSLDIPPEYGPLSTRALCASVPRFHLLPIMHFGGFHPDCVAVRLDDAPVGGPAGTLHSRIVVAGFLAGLTAEQTAGLFNTLVYARLGYFGALEEHTALLVEKFAAYAIDLSVFVAKWRAAGCFMTSPHHPKIRVFVDLARICCAMMGLAPRAEPNLMALRDPLAMRSTMPFLPEIAARYGMQPEGVFRDSLPALPMALPDFVRGSMRALARVPLSCLRAAPGVAEAMARLDLRPVRRDPRPSMTGQDVRCLIGWHGSIVRVESASSLLVHEPLWPASADCSDFTLRPIANADGTARAAMLGGLDILPAGPPGAVSVRRQGRALTAAAGRLAVPFKGDGTGLEEAFLPVSLEVAAHLRTILSQDWAWQGTPRGAASARIRLRAGFILDFGIFAIDLSQTLPKPVPAGQDGGAGYLFPIPDGAITIRPAGEVTRGREIALLAEPQRRWPEDPGSIPAFRVARQASWPLYPPDEIVHPPLTGSDRDTAWVFERCTSEGGLPSGLVQHQAVLRRLTGCAVLLSAGMEGVLLDADGSLADNAAAGLRQGQILPPGIRLEDGALLIEAECMAAAPMIDEPVAACLCPAWLGEDGWLLDVALRLHVMAPFLPRGARLLVPPGFAGSAPAHLAMLDALGLNQWPALEAPTPLVRLGDAVWLDRTELTDTPASLLRSFRARIAALFPAPAGAPKRIFIAPGGARRIVPNDALDGFLAAQNFTVVVPEDMAPGERIALFRGAEMVIGAHGAALADIVFCPEGTRVIEISPRGQFRSRYWMLAEKCGLIYGVLPCATDGGGFESPIQLDVGRLRGLFRVLRLALEN